MICQGIGGGGPGVYFGFARGEGHRFLGKVDVCGYVLEDGGYRGPLQAAVGMLSKVFYTDLYSCTSTMVGVHTC